MYTSSALAAAALLISSVSAHGHVQTVTVGTKSYQGWDPALAYDNPVPATVGWPAQNLDNGFVNDYGSTDIICHKSATPAQAYVPVTAGQTIGLVWNTWPDSHKGPVINYLASCGSSCTTADKTKLSFAKVQAGGWISGNNPGTWETDNLIKNAFTGNFKVPSSLKTGLYVLRHEIIALHAAGSPNGAQSYPQCINLNVTGTGSSTVSGVPATSFYKATDPGILFNLYSTWTSYTIPGPALVSIAKRAVRMTGWFGEY